MAQEIEGSSPSPHPYGAEMFDKITKILLWIVLAFMGYLYFAGILYKVKGIYILPW